MEYLYRHVCLRMAASGVAFYRGIPLKLSRESLFQGCHGCSDRVAVYREALYRGLTGNKIV